MKRDEKTITHAFVAIYQERSGEVWMQVECGVLVGEGNGSHAIAEHYEDPTCPACAEALKRKKPRPKKPIDAAKESEVMWRAIKIMEENAVSFDPALREFAEALEREEAA